MYQKSLLIRPLLYGFIICILMNNLGYAQTKPDDIAVLIEKCAPDVSPVTMRYLLRVESNFEPYSLNINTKPSSKSLLFKDAISAIAMANKLFSQGANIDMGLGQINSGTMQRLSLSVAELYDPCLNISASATVLKACYLHARKAFPAEQDALKHALSCYNTGDFQRGITNGYVNKLQKLAATHALVVPELLATENATALNAERTKRATFTKEGEEDVFGTAVNQEAFDRQTF